MARAGAGYWLAAVLVIAGGAARAEPALAPRAEQGSETLRSYVMRNNSDQAIVQGTAVSTRGTSFDLTKGGPIRARLAQNFMMQHGECLDQVHLKLANGRTLDSTGMNACENSQIFTDGSHVWASSNASNRLTDPGRAAPELGPH